MSKKLFLGLIAAMSLLGPVVADDKPAEAAREHRQEMGEKRREHRHEMREKRREHRKEMRHERREHRKEMGEQHQQGK